VGKQLDINALLVTTPGLSQQTLDGAWADVTTDCEPVAPTPPLPPGSVLPDDWTTVYGMNNRRWAGDLWPPEYARLGKAIIYFCFEVGIYNNGQEPWAAASVTLPLKYKEMKSALSALPGDSQAQLRRAIEARQ
jgi:hypothetical protein